MPVLRQHSAHQHAAHETLTARLRAAGCVFAEDEARLLMDAARTPEDLEAMAGRRVSGLPLEHILGWAEFCGLRIAVAAGVFVPRRRTEFLVRQAAVLLGAWRQAPGGASRPAPVVVDLCCGSGAVGRRSRALRSRRTPWRRRRPRSCALCAAATLCRWAGRPTKAISMIRCRRNSGAASGCWPSTPPMFRRRRSAPCRRRHACTSPGPASTAAPTGWTCSDG